VLYFLSHASHPTDTKKKLEVLVTGNTDGLFKKHHDALNKDDPGIVERILSVHAGAFFDVAKNSDPKIMINLYDRYGETPDLSSEGIVLLDNIRDWKTKGFTHRFGDVYHTALAKLLKKAKCCEDDEDDCELEKKGGGRRRVRNSLKGGRRRVRNSLKGGRRRVRNSLKGGRRRVRNASSRKRR